MDDEPEEPQALPEPVGALRSTGDFWFLNRDQVRDMSKDGWSDAMLQAEEFALGEFLDDDDQH